jgi:hypothetical protein
MNGGMVAFDLTNCENRGTSSGILGWTSERLAKLQQHPRIED